MVGHFSPMWLSFVMMMLISVMLVGFGSTVVALIITIVITITPHCAISLGKIPVEVAQINKTGI